MSVTNEVFLGYWCWLQILEGHTACPDLIVIIQILCVSWLDNHEGGGTWGGSVCLSKIAMLMAKLGLVFGSIHSQQLSGAGF